MTAIQAAERQAMLATIRSGGALTQDTITRVLAALRKIEGMPSNATPAQIGEMMAEAKIARIYIEVDLGHSEIQAEIADRARMCARETAAEMWSE
jgi:hypothetical protein